MRAFSFVTVIFVVSVQFSCLSGKVVVPEQKTIIDTLSEDARNLLKSFGDATGLSQLDAEKVIQRIEADAKVVAANIDGFVDKVKKDIESRKPEVEKLLKNVQAELTKTSQSLKKLVGPDVTKKAEEIRKSFEKNLEAAIEPINKVIKAVKPDVDKLKDDLEASGKVVLNSIIDGAKKIQSEVANTPK